MDTIVAGHAFDLKMTSPDAYEDRAKSDGKARMDLTTARTNHRAQQLYESMGWVRDEVFFAYSRRTGKPSAS